MPLWMLLPDLYGAWMTQGPATLFEGNEEDHLHVDESRRCTEGRPIVVHTAKGAQGCWVVQKGFPGHGITAVELRGCHSQSMIEQNGFGRESQLEMLPKSQPTSKYASEEIPVSGLTLRICVLVEVGSVHLL